MERRKFIVGIAASTIPIIGLTSNQQSEPEQKENGGGGDSNKTDVDIPNSRGGARERYEKYSEENDNTSRCNDENDSEYPETPSIEYTSEPSTHKSNKKDVYVTIEMNDFDEVRITRFEDPHPWREMPVRRITEDVEDKHLGEFYEDTKFGGEMIKYRDDYEILINAPRGSI